MTTKGTERKTPRTRWGTALGLLTAVLATLGVVAPAQDAAAQEVRVAWYRVGHTAPLHVLPKFAEKRGVKIKLIEFKRYADARTALASGDLDFGALGPQDVAFAVAGGARNVVGIAGLALLGDVIVVRNGVKVDTWEDFTKIRVAVGAGSISWTKFVTALVEANVPYSKVNVINVAGGGGEYVKAMQRGDVDAFVAWEPFGAEAVLKGVGYYPPTNHNATKTIGGINSVLAANRGFLEQHGPVAQKVVEAYVEAVEHVRTHPEEWARDYAEYSGIGLDVAALALKGIRLDYALPQQKIQQLTKFLFDNGVLKKDVAAEIFPGYHDYSLLAKATGKSPKDLGQQ